MPPSHPLPLEMAVAQIPDGNERGHGRYISIRAIPTATPKLQGTPRPFVEPVRRNGSQVFWLQRSLTDGPHLSNVRGLRPDSWNCRTTLDEGQGITVEHPWKSQADRNKDC